MNSCYQFKNRHIGPDGSEIKKMLEVVEAASVDEMIFSCSTFRFFFIKVVTNRSRYLLRD